MSYTVEETYYWVAKNMLSDKKINDEEINEFISKYSDIISEVVSYMPRGMTSIGAAVANCAIHYDRDKAINFIKNAKDRIFQGKEDPVYHFYMWLHGIKGPKRKKHDISTYEVTLYACKNYCLGKKIKRLDRVKGNFSWNENFEVKKKEVKTMSDQDLVEEFIDQIRNNNFSSNELKSFMAALCQRKNHRTP
jgi:hypothetical protein